MADVPDVKVVLCGGFSIIHGEIGLHDVTLGLVHDPEDPDQSYDLLAFCLVRNAPPTADETYVQICRTDADGVEVVVRGAAPLFPNPLFPGYAMAFVSLDTFTVSGIGTYTLEVGGDGAIWHQEPLPVLNIEDIP
jgi:hypothetical protein